MERLKIIENGMVPVYETSTGEKVVDGRELHSVLKSRQDFSTWIKKRLLDCDAVEKEDYDLLHNFVEQTSGAKHRIDYIIKLDTAKEMAMLERNKKGKEVRRYFIQIEKKYKIQLAELADSIKQFMDNQTKTNQVQTEFNQKIMERLEHLERPARNRGSYKGNPFLTDDEDDIEARKEELYAMTGKIAGMWGYQHTQILHQLYKMLEIRLGIVLNCYREVYRSETGKEDACMAEVIASHDWIYEKAVELCEYAVEKVQNMN